MNPYLILAGAAGFVGGVVLGVYIGEHRADEKAREEIARETGEIRQELISKYQRKPEVVHEKPVEDFVPPVNPYDNISDEKCAELDEAGQIIGMYDDDKIAALSKMEYDDECDWHDKVSLTYYTKDDVLVDETGEIWDDDSPIGKALEFFGYDKKDFSFVRNYDLEIDYAIERVDDYYSRVVLGVPLRVNKKGMKFDDFDED